MAMAELSSFASVLATRVAHTASHVGLSYSTSASGPLLVVRGEGSCLYDDEGRRYVDCVNNVAHLGHCHPRLIAALTTQAQRCNTNTRYLSVSVASYVRSLLALFPPSLSLSVVYLCNSGSEANDLALRLCRAYTGAEDVLVLDAAYHGHTAAMVECSPYKWLHQGKGRIPCPSHVHLCATPDLPSWRRRRRREGERGTEAVEAGEEAEEEAAAAFYAADVSRRIDDVRATGRRLCAFLCESSPSCAGQQLLPRGYLPRAFAAVRQAGGVCVADEVQTGLGRNGRTHFEFQRLGAEPDIVTLGKGLGGGVWPLAAVVCRGELSAALVATGLEHFNTSAGTHVAGAVGEAVLRAMEEEGRKDWARQVGERWLEGLRRIQSRFPALVADVRGVGLFIGLELRRQKRGNKAGEAAHEEGEGEESEPATEEASWLVNRLRGMEETLSDGRSIGGVLLSTDGPHGNVLKIKPPLCISHDEVDCVNRCLDAALRELTQQPSHTHER